MPYTRDKPPVPTRLGLCQSCCEIIAKANIKMSYTGFRGWWPDPKQKDFIVENWPTMAQTVMAKTLNVSMDQLFRVARRLNLPYKANRSFKPHWDEFRRLYVEEEWSTSDIAEKFGCSAATVTAALRILEVPVRKTRRPYRKKTNGVSSSPRFDNMNLRILQNDEP